MRSFSGDDSAWADFLISKSALILTSIVIFAAIFHVVAGFKDLETQDQLDYLAQDFKTRVDEAGVKIFQDGFPEGLPGNSQATFDSPETFYCFNDKEIFQALDCGEDVRISVSGEYICLEVESDERNFRAVKPFAFRVLPFNQTSLQEKLRIRFGVDGSKMSPLNADYREIKDFLQVLGTQKAFLDPEESIVIRKELVYVKDRKGVSAFGCILIYQ